MNQEILGSPSSTSQQNMTVLIHGMEPNEHSVKYLDRLVSKVIKQSLENEPRQLQVVSKNFSYKTFKYRLTTFFGELFFGPLFSKVKEIMQLRYPEEFQSTLSAPCSPHDHDIRDTMTLLRKILISFSFKKL